MPADRYDPATPEGRKSIRELLCERPETWTMIEVRAIHETLPRLLAMAEAGEAMALELRSRTGGFGSKALAAWERAKKGGDRGEA